uniref:RNA-directed RNA polymerase n=1 Tax=Steinernema glaseri TaxID=37863 RepID=A0A1I8AKL2_9BILA
AYYLEGKKIDCSARELCSQVLFTCYMGTENSSALTKNMSTGLAGDIGATHSTAVMNGVVNSYLNLCNSVHDYVPSFTRDDPREGLACQNIQARSRMVAAYLLAQNAIL